MALANFFSRTEEALTEVLFSVEPKLLKAHLEHMFIAIAFNDSSLENDNEQNTLELCANLLARMYPTIGIIYLGSSLLGLEKRKDLILQAQAINPDIEILDSSSRFLAVISLSNDVKCLSENHLYISSESWNLEVTYNKPTTLKGRNYNPISAAAAACIAVGIVFRIVFKEFLSKDKLDDSYEDIKLSLLDYSKEFSPSEELPEIVFKDLTLVGVGAIGNAVVWCLNHIPKLSGTIYLIDHELIDLSNLQRYVLTKQDSVNVSKVKLAKEFLKNKNLKVNTHKKCFGDYVKKNRSSCKFDIIGISVDNAHDRIAAQAVLPKLIFNSWTAENGFLGVSRHQFDQPDNACLACLYLSTEKKKSYTEEIAELTGIDHRFVAEMVVKETPLNRQLIEEISKNRDYPLDILLRFEGKNLDSFYRDVACGSLNISLSKNTSRKETVPLAHQSVLAGVILACELIKSALNITQQKNTVEIRLNVMDNLPDYIRLPRKKTIFPMCICCDEDYITVYKKKYQKSN